METDSDKIITIEIEPNCHLVLECHLNTIHCAIYWHYGTKNQDKGLGFYLGIHDVYRLSIWLMNAMYQILSNR